MSELHTCYRTSSLTCHKNPQPAVLSTSFEVFKLKAMKQILPEMISLVIYPQTRHEHKDLDTPVGIKLCVYDIILAVNFAAQCQIIIR